MKIGRYKTKILIGALAIGVVLVGGWFILGNLSQYPKEPEYTLEIREDRDSRDILLTGQSIERYPPGFEIPTIKRVVDRTIYITLGKARPATDFLPYLMPDSAVYHVNLGDLNGNYTIKIRKNLRTDEFLATFLDKKASLKKIRGSLTKTGNLVVDRKSNYYYAIIKTAIPYFTDKNFKEIDLPKDMVFDYLGTAILLGEEIIFFEASDKRRVLEDYFDMVFESDNSPYLTNINFFIPANIFVGLLFVKSSYLKDTLDYLKDRGYPVKRIDAPSPYPSYLKDCYRVYFDVEKDFVNNREEIIDYYLNLKVVNIHQPATSRPAIVMAKWNEIKEELYSRGYLCVR